MEITRRCPVCDEVTSMNIDIDYNKSRKEMKVKPTSLELKQEKFMESGMCVECQRIIYRSKKELERNKILKVF